MHSKIEINEQRYEVVHLNFALRLPEAERALIKAEKCSEKFSKLANSGGADIQLDLDIVTGMGQ